MRIGIIGINKYAEYLNWACPVHCYAFQQYLLKKGYDCEVVDYYPTTVKDFDFTDPVGSYAGRLFRSLGRLNEAVEEELPIEEIKRIVEKREVVDDKFLRNLTYTDSVKAKLFSKKVAKNIKLYNGMKDLTEEFHSRWSKFINFANNNIKYTEKKFTSESIEHDDPGFDMYITPTDVLWRWIDTRFEKAYFLATPVFDGKKKIAYSVSRGNFDGYNKKQESFFRQAVEDYDYVSIREQELFNYVKGNTNANPVMTIDPVFLHDRDFWHKVAVKPKEENYVLLYYVMEKAADTIDMAIEYAKKHNLKIIELSDRPIPGGMANNPEINQISKYDISPEEWIGYLENAEYIFTNSFHGTCFAIIFNKLFMSGKRSVTKIQNVLNLLKVPENTETELLNNKPITKSINWEPIEKELKKYVAESENFLLTAIEESSKGNRAEKKDNRQNKDLRGKVEYHRGAKKELLKDFKKLKWGKLAKALKDSSKQYKDAPKNFVNDGTFLLPRNTFSVPGKKFEGWRVGIKNGKEIYWYMKNGTLDLYSNKKAAQGVVLFREETLIPYLSVEDIAPNFKKDNNTIVVEAMWGKK